MPVNAKTQADPTIQQEERSLDSSFHPDQSIQSGTFEPSGQEKGGKSAGVLRKIQIIPSNRWTVSNGGRSTSRLMLSANFGGSALCGVLAMFSEEVAPAKLLLW